MSETEKNPRILPLVLTIVFLLVASGLGYLGLKVLDRLDAIETQVTALGEEASRAATASNDALEQARRAEESARAAAERGAGGEGHTSRQETAHGAGRGGERAGAGEDRFAKRPGRPGGSGPHPAGSGSGVTARGSAQQGSRDPE
jgi:hypothetical protein